MLDKHLLIGYGTLAQTTRRRASTGVFPPAGRTTEVDLTYPWAPGEGNAAGGIPLDRRHRRHTGQATSQTSTTRPFAQDDRCCANKTNLGSTGNT